MVRPEKVRSWRGLRQVKAACMGMPAPSAYGVVRGTSRAGRQCDLRCDGGDREQAPEAHVPVGEVARMAADPLALVDHILDSQGIQARKHRIHRLRTGHRTAGVASFHGRRPWRSDATGPASRHPAEPRLGQLCPWWGWHHHEVGRQQDRPRTAEA